MESPVSQYVQLNRKFRELSEESDNEDEDAFISTLRIDQGIGWQDLLEEYRVLILSEAGAGKTWELNNVAQTLEKEGKPAFFFRLENLAENFDTSFEVGHIADFKRWILSDEPGWLFLDSIDEAKLKSPHDFKRAVMRVGKEIAGAKNRAHIFIAGRPYAWRSGMDVDICTRHLGQYQHTTSEKRTESSPRSESSVIGTVSVESDEAFQLKVVGLNDLNSEQIYRFIDARDIPDAKQFLECVERMDATSFTRNPFELSELAAYWKENGSIPDRYKLFKNGVVRRLREHDADRSQFLPLSEARARHGARQLAATVTLTKSPNLKIPGGEPGITGVSVEDALPHWDERERSALLSRPLFDESTYGSVRFYHIEARELLVAEWLYELLSRPGNRGDIENLIFSNKYGIEVVRPGFRAALPWLCEYDPKILSDIRRIDLDVVLEGGDAKSLPLPSRRAILRQLVREIASGAIHRSARSLSAIQSFVSEDIAQDLHDILRENEGNEEIVTFVLRMIWIGGLRSFLKEAKDYATDSSQRCYLRSVAIRAVGEIGEEDDIGAIWESLSDEKDPVDRQLVSELLAVSRATKSTAKMLADVLVKVADRETYSVDKLELATENLVSRAQQDQLPDLVVMFRGLLNRKPLVDSRVCEVSKEFQWLAGAAEDALIRLIKERDIFCLTIDSLDVLHLLVELETHGPRRYRVQSTDLPELLRGWPELNRAVFWHELAMARSAHGAMGAKDITNVWQIGVRYRLWSFSSSDIQYLIRELEGTRVTEDKLVVLSILFNIYVKEGRPARLRNALKRACANDVELQEALVECLHPPKQDEETKKLNRRHRRVKERARARKVAEIKKREDSKAYLEEHLDEIVNWQKDNPGELSSALHYLFEMVREKQDSDNRWTGGNWAALIEDYGEILAQFYRSSILQFWRHHTPALRSEGAPHNQTPYATIIGLSGIDVESRELDSWPKGLSPDEVKLVCRYAIHELNGFPTWFSRVYECFPDVVVDLIKGEIEYELKADTDKEEQHYVLSDVCWSGDWLWAGVGPALLTILRSLEPENVSKLEKVLKVLAGSGCNMESLIALADRKCRDEGHWEHWARWCAFRTILDASRAIPDLERALAELSSSEDKTRAAMVFITNLVGEDRQIGLVAASELTMSADDIYRLYLLMSQYIRREDDIDRLGKGVYSPGLRDWAQDSRNRLLDWLIEMSSEESYSALLKIIDSEPSKYRASMLRQHARKKAERAAELPIWDAGEVYKFFLDRNANPRNSYELADLTNRILLEIKSDLEDSDDSLAPILSNVEVETDIRVFLSRELRNKANGRYSVAQEDELADKKRTDIRVHGSGFDTAVPIELKLADNWTGNKLVERLENQLCGDYLRDERSREGIFLLVYRGEKKKWRFRGMPSQLTFRGVVDYLTGYVNELVDSLPDVDGISVIGIDLTKRLQ